MSNCDVRPAHQESQNTKSATRSEIQNLYSNFTEPSCDALALSLIHILYNPEIRKHQKNVKSSINIVLFFLFGVVVFQILIIQILQSVCQHQQLVWIAANWGLDLACPPSFAAVLYSILIWPPSFVTVSPSESGVPSFLCSCALDLVSFLCYCAVLLPLLLCCTLLWHLPSFLCWCALDMVSFLCYCTVLLLKFDLPSFLCYCVPDLLWYCW